MGLNSAYVCTADISRIQTHVMLQMIPALQESFEAPRTWKGIQPKLFKLIDKNSSL